jgi:hypothetical protein
LGATVTYSAGILEVFTGHILQINYEKLGKPKKKKEPCIQSEKAGE